jgi:ABC-type branched-subunit amino acid transport system substrate-binding protein
MIGSRRRSLPILAAGAATVLALGACSNNSGTPGSDDPDGVYNWGVDVELSGSLSYYGLSIEDGIAAYVDQVNANGGINGHKIKLTSLDSAGEASRSAANATQLITVNEVNAIFGHSLSSNCSAAQPIVERHKVPMACLSVAEPSPWVFNLGPDNAGAAPALFAAAKKVTGKTNPTAALVYLNTLTDIALAEAVAETAESAGVTILTSQEIDLRAGDQSAQIAATVAANPDVILISHTGPGVVTFLRAVRAANITAPLVWLDGTAQISFLADENDDAAYGMSVHQLADPDSTEPAVQEFVKAVTPYIDGEVTATSLNNGEYITAYATAAAFGEALKACGWPCPGEKLRDEVEKVSISLPGLVPNFVYTPDNHYPYKEWYLYKVKGDERTLVDTLPGS